MKAIRMWIAMILAILMVTSLTGVAEGLTIDGSAEGLVAAGSEWVSEPQALQSNAIPSKITIGVKEQYTINTSGMSGKISFKSANKKVATVTDKGVIKGIATGKTKITVKPGNGTKKTIAVTVAKAPTKVTLNKKSVSMSVGEQFQLKATLPKNTASCKLTWKSSKKSIATVDSKGCVKAKAAGTATITVKTFNGKKATCKVKVSGDSPKPQPTGPIQLQRLWMDGAGKKVSVGDTVTYYIQARSTNPISTVILWLKSAQNSNSIKSAVAFDDMGNGTYRLDYTIDSGMYPGKWVIDWYYIDDIYGDFIQEFFSAKEYSDCYFVIK